MSRERSRRSAGRSRTPRRNSSTNSRRTPSASFDSRRVRPDQLLRGDYVTLAHAHLNNLHRLRIVLASDSARANSNSPPPRLVQGPMQGAHPDLTFVEQTFCAPIGETCPVYYHTMR